MRKMVAAGMIMVLLGSCSVFGADEKAGIAVEWEEDGKFGNIIGKMEVSFSENGDYMEVFVFNGKWNKSVIDVYTHIFEVIERVQYQKDGYRIQCRNEMGTFYTGSVDLSDLEKPKFEITNGRGQVIKNITSRGQRFKSKYFPEINLGD